MKFDLQDWLFDDVRTLWSSAGIDPGTHITWEALDHQGRAIPHLPRRLRVIARQAYSLSVLGEACLAEQHFHFCMTQGFDHQGRLISVFSPDLTEHEAPHDLYDLSFVMLAAAEMGACDLLSISQTERLKVALARLKAPVGWSERLVGNVPRRQNPHMHLFEASMSLFEVTSDTHWLDVAVECFALLSQVFLQADGTLHEFFDHNWSPLPAYQQKIEPGHMAEWVHLLAKYQRITKLNTQMLREKLWHKVLQLRDVAGLLPNCGQSQGGHRRLWPQTELMRAAQIMDASGSIAHKVSQRIVRDYLVGVARGGWSDLCDSHGHCLSSHMPASTLYHLVGAFDCTRDAEKSQIGAHIALLSAGAHSHKAQHHAIR